MRTEPSIIAPTSIRVIFDFVAADQGNTPLVFTGFTTYNEFTTNSLVFVDWFTATYTIDLNGVLSVIDIFLYLVTFNDANSRLKIQISKDGGATFVDVTGEIGLVGLGGDDITSGSGNWISSIDTGLNKLQIKVQAKSTGGDATARINGISYLKMIYNKKII